MTLPTDRIERAGDLRTSIYMCPRILGFVLEAPSIPREHAVRDEVAVSD